MFMTNRAYNYLICILPCFKQILNYHSLHLVGSNIQKVFVPTGLNKSRLIKKISDEEGKRNKNAMKLNEKGQEGYFIETHNILEKYLGRPESLRWISAMQFSKRYCDIGVYKKFENEEKKARRTLRKLNCFEAPRK